MSDLVTHARAMLAVFGRDEEGRTKIETGLLLGCIAMVVASILLVLGHDISSLLTPPPAA
jgi:Flp pilus assembly pilin Flp